MFLSRKTDAEQAVSELLADLVLRLSVSPLGNCPVSTAGAFVALCRSQSCGKCVPCRIGLAQLSNLLEDIASGAAGAGGLALLEKTAQAIYETADCAIGYEAAHSVLRSLRAFPEDYQSHARGGRCSPEAGATVPGAVPCVKGCPANVDIPGYIALIAAGRPDDAVRLIRKDNPFPAVCGLICEHPCETRCRRMILDSAVNIRGLKRFATDTCAEKVPVPSCAPDTGKRVAVVGGGPAGLTAAYYLALMGHRVTIYEKRKYLGGMLRYGIPSYRLPRERLQWDIDAVLSTGNITVKLETDIGDAAAIHALGAQYHSLFLTIGAHTEKRLGIEGESLRGVMSAVELLRAIGDNAFPDFTGKRVAVIGGGNVAMDAARSAIRLGAAKVSLVYRRRQEDMTALPEEVYGAAAEGCDLVTLQAPLKIEGNASDEAVALWTEPQMIGPMENGRPKPVCAGKAPVRLPCDILILAIGQDIDSKAFAEYGVKTRRGAIAAGPDGSIEGMSHDPGMAGVFAGGDCVTGPATVIRAIEAGKVAASNIDRALGFSHTITCDMEIPAPPLGDKKPWGRVNMEERESSARKRDFDPVEAPMSCPEATGEAGRCLRCDKFGLGAFRGGRIRQW